MNIVSKTFYPESSDPYCPPNPDLKRPRTGQTLNPVTSDNSRDYNYVKPLDFNQTSKRHCPDDDREDRDYHTSNSSDGRGIRLYPSLNYKLTKQKSCPWRSTSTHHIQGVSKSLTDAECSLTPYQYPSEPGNRNLQSNKQEQEDLYASNYDDNCTLQYYEYDPNRPAKGKSQAKKKRDRAENSCYYKST